MDFMQILFSYLIIGVIISVCVSTVNLMFKPFVDIEKYSLITGFIFSLFIFITYNNGIMTTLEIPLKTSLQPYFHYVDVFITGVIGMGGAVGFHKVIEGIKQYSINKNMNK